MDMLSHEKMYTNQQEAVTNKKRTQKLVKLWSPFSFAHGLTVQNLCIVDWFYQVFVT